MYKRKDFATLMPEGYDIMVHLHNIENVNKQVKISIKGINLKTNTDFVLETTEDFEPIKVASKVKSLLLANNIESAEYTDVTIYQ